MTEDRPEKKRLLGVTLLAVGNVLAAVPLLLYGILFVTWKGESVSLNYPIAIWILLGEAPLVLVLGVTGQLAAMTEGGDPWAKMMGISHVGGAILLLFGGSACAMAVGLWQRRNWARIISLTLAPINFLLSLLSVRPLFLLLPLLALYAGRTWYMFRHNVKSSFGT